MIALLLSGFLVQLSFSSLNSLGTCSVIKGNDDITINLPQSCEATLPPGKFLIELWGAQGGKGLLGKEVKGIGGKGAYAKGELRVNGDLGMLYFNVGGKGGDAAEGSGGFNGGGKGGKDSGIWPGAGDDSGGGGGATDIRTGEDYGKRIIVAGGGSGAAYGFDGAFGGDENGYKLNSSKNYIKAPDSEGNKNGIGGDGIDSAWNPGSGGGGGFIGGAGGSNKWVSDYHLTVGTSGSSFVGDVFSNPEIYNGNTANYGKEGDGKIRVTIIYECPTGCHSCEGSKNGQCTKCFNGHFLHEGNCIEECPTGTYKNSENNINECSKCFDPNCATCSGGEKDNCTSCISPYKLNPDFTCNSSCSDGSFPLADGNCEICNETCFTCNGPTSTNCLSCKEGFKLYNSECYEICPNGTYEKDEKTCQSCNLFCSKCTGPSSNGECSECKEGYYYFNQSCYQDNCPKGSYSEAKTDKPYECYECESKCLTCKGGTSKDCTSCKEGTYLFNNECYENCSTITIDNNSYISNSETKQCERCDISYCNKYDISKNTCQCIECSLNSTIDHTLNKCSVCEEEQQNNCYKCNSKNECLECHEGYILNSTHYCIIKVTEDNEESDKSESEKSESEKSESEKSESENENGSTDNSEKNSKDKKKKQTMMIGIIVGVVVVVIIIIIIIVIVIIKKKSQKDNEDEIQSENMETMNSSTASSMFSADPSVINGLTMQNPLNSTTINGNNESSDPFSREIDENEI